MMEDNAALLVFVLCSSFAGCFTFEYKDYLKEENDHFHAARPSSSGGDHALTGMTVT